MPIIVRMRELDIPAVDLNLLALLEALYAAASVTRAGEALGLSQPAASRALGRLRRMFGDPLFVRAGGSLVATPRARRLQEPLLRALAELRGMLAPEAFDPGTAAGSVRLVAPDLEAATLAPLLLARFSEQAPGLDLAFVPRRGDGLAMLAADDADIAIGVFDRAPAGFRRQRLYRDTMVCVVRADHPVLKRGLSLARFVTLRHALVTITGEGGGAVDAALAARGLQRRIALRIPSFIAAPLVVARSELIVTLPRRAAERFAALAPVALVEPPLPIPAFNLSQLWHERQHADPRHRWLRATVAELAAKRGPAALSAPAAAAAARSSPAARA